jgi:hypothetical protein
LLEVGIREKEKTEILFFFALSVLSNTVALDSVYTVKASLLIVVSFFPSRNGFVDTPPSPR